MGFEQARPAIADQKRFEDAVATDGGQVVGVQQRGLRVVQFAVERDHDRLLAAAAACHGQEA